MSFSPPSATPPDSSSSSGSGALLQGAKCVGCGCTDRVSLHYGAPSCHGCKAFFRRTIFENRRYYCSGEGNCEITDESRNHCRYCRFENCLRGGMSKKCIREERAKESRHMERRKQPPSNRVTDNTPADEHPLTLRLVEIERETLEEKEHQGPDSLRSRIMKDFNIPEGTIDHNTNNTCERVMNDSDLMDSFYRTFRILCDWASGINNFRTLPQPDQVLLFRQNFLALTWLHFSYATFTTRQETVGIPFGNGSFIPYSEEHKRQLHPKWHDTYAFLGTKLIDTIVVPMIALNMDDEEYVILKAMALFIPDNQLSHEGQRIVSQMKDLLTKALSIHTDRRFPAMPHLEKSQRCTQITLLLASLMAAAQLEASFVQQISQQGLPF